MRMRATGVATFFVAMGVAAMASAQTPTYYGLRCTSSDGTFKVSASLPSLQCANGHCVFGPFTYQLPSSPCKGAYTDADLIISGWKWQIPSRTSVVSMWHLWLQKTSWDAATKTLTYNVIIEADNQPGQHLDGQATDLVFQIVGTTGVASRIVRFTQSCSAQNTTCTASSSYVLPRGWAYSGQALNRLSITTDTALSVGSIAADSSGWQLNFGKVTAPTSCSIAGTPTQTLTSCTFGVVGLSMNPLADPRELEELSMDLPQVFPQLPRFTGGFALYPAPPYPRAYLCGLQKFDLSFQSSGQAIWDMSTGVAYADCDGTSNGTIWSGQYTEFLGDTASINTNQQATFSGSTRLWGAKFR